MKKTILIYGLSLAVLVFLLEYFEYRYFVHELSTEVFVFFIAFSDADAYFDSVSHVNVREITAQLRRLKCSYQLISGQLAYFDLSDSADSMNVRNDPQSSSRRQVAPSDQAV